MKRVILTITFILTANISHADYHYASHSGSNEYPYTSWETAADSIQKAINAASPGDTIYIGSGEYEEVIVMDVADSLMSFIGRGTDSTWIYTHQQRAHLITTAHKSYWENIHFSNFEGYSCMQAFVARDITIENCYFSYTLWPASAILFDASHVVIRNCLFENIRGEAIEEFSVNQSLIISNCLFKDVWVEAFFGYSRHAVVRNNIVLNASSGYWSFSVGGLEPSSYELLENNVVHNVNSGAFNVHFFDSLNVFKNNTADETYSPADNAVDVVLPYADARVVNNSLTNTQRGMAANGPYQLSVHYSNFWNNQSTAFVTRNGASFDTSYGLIHQDPMFVDPDSGDLHLQAYSPLIDAGDPSILDVDGSRSDIGAYGGPGGSSYEYQDLPPSVPDSIAYRVWNDTIYLDWKANYESDFFGYLLHRDTISNFTPSEYNLISQPESSFYADADVIIGETYYYRIASIDSQGNRSDYSPEIAVTVTGVWQGDGAEMPRMTVIESNYPNPFNSNTTIVYTVANLGPIPAEIKINIYDIGGRRVRNLVNERKGVGIYKVTWNGKDDFGNALPSGTYFAKISQWGLDFMSKSKKLILLK